MKKMITAVVLMLIMSALFLPGCSIEPVIKTAIIFDSPIADDDFSTACLRGTEKAQKETGTPLTIYESLNESQTAELLKELVTSKGYSVIVCVGSSNNEPLNELSVKYPKQHFILVDGDIAAKENVCSLLLRDNESSFLAGALAAMTSRSGKIGFIGGMDISPIHRFLAGYQAGAAYVNPDCEVLVDYSGTWLNDGKTRELALAQYGQGADVIFSACGAGSLGVISTAKEKGLYAIGVDKDQSALAPQNVIGSTLKNVDTALYNTIMSAAAGNFQGGIQTSGLKDGGVSFAINPDVHVITQAIADAITGIQQKIISGEIIVPDGSGA